VSRLLLITVQCSCFQPCALFDLRCCLRSATPKSTRDGRPCASCILFYV
jgi:hypothetical protein